MARYKVSENTTSVSLTDPRGEDVVLDIKNGEVEATTPWMEWALDNHPDFVSSEASQAPAPKALPKASEPATKSNGGNE